MDDGKLVLRLRQFFGDRDTAGFGVWDFVHAEGSPLLALMYARLFWPTFEEIDGMILLKDGVEDDADRARVRDALDKSNGDRAFVERSFNLRQVEDLFGSRINDTSDAEDCLLAALLREMWQCRVCSLYPRTQFHVLVVPPEETGGSVGVTIYQK
jgi:hypothetical protein